jgi:predicted RNase H-like HicB family nuclease
MMRLDYRDEGTSMLTEYIRAAMRRATYEILPEDKTYYGEIPGFQGVWANAETLEACRDELQEVLEDWIVFRLHDHLSLPIVDGMEIGVKEAV